MRALTVAYARCVDSKQARWQSIADWPVYLNPRLPNLAGGLIIAAAASAAALDLTANSTSFSSCPTSHAGLTTRYEHVFCRCYAHDGSGRRGSCPALSPSPGRLRRRVADRRATRPFSFPTRRSRARVNIRPVSGRRGNSYCEQTAAIGAVGYHLCVSRCSCSARPC